MHQDWDLDHATVWDALDDFVAGEPRSVGELGREVRELRRRDLSEDALREVVGNELRCDYWPPGDGLTYSSWLAEVDRRLSGDGDPEPS